MSKNYRYSTQIVVSSFYVKIKVMTVPFCKYYPLHFVTCEPANLPTYFLIKINLVQAMFCCLLCIVQFTCLKQANVVSKQSHTDALEIALVHVPETSEYQILSVLSYILVIFSTQSSVFMLLVINSSTTEDKMNKVKQIETVSLCQFSVSAMAMALAHSTNRADSVLSNVLFHL